MFEKLDRTDEKWGHPEVVDAGMYGMRMAGDFIGLLGADDETLKQQSEGMLAMLKGMVFGDPMGLYDGIKISEYQAEGGCPEDRDMAPVRVVVSAPENLEPDEKLPLIFSCSAAILPGAISPAELGLNNRAEIAAGLDKFIHASYDTTLCVPRNQYPGGVNEAHTAYQFLVDHADELHIDTDRIVLSGYSSGAFSAFTLAFRLKRYNWCGAPMPRGIVAYVPVMEDLSFTESQRYDFTAEDGAKLSWDGEQDRLCLASYLGESFGDPTLPPEVVPSRATVEDVSGGFPPVWVPCEAEFDPSRDTLISFMQTLQKAGVFCDLHLWGGVTHQSFQLMGTSLGDRFFAIKAGCFHDAATYDFRRPWLAE